MHAGSSTTRGTLNQDAPWKVRARVAGWARGGGVPGDAVTEIVTQRPPQGATGGDVTHRGPRPFAARTIEELRRRGRSTGRTVDPEVAGSSPVEPAIRINNVGAVMSRALGVSVTVLAS